MAYFQCVKVGGGGGSANIVELTQAEYDALPSSKESDNVLYIVYFDGGQILDPDYSYHKYGDNDEIIVRVYHEGQSDQQILWFFNGWNQTSLDMSIPTELQAYKPSNTSPIFSDSYATVGGTQTSWFGFYNNNFRSWDLSLGGQYIGIIHAVVNPFPSSTGQQMNGYYSPYVYIQSSTPTRRIYLNEHEYSEFNKTNVEELTQTDYDALSPTQKNNGGIYFIKKQSGGTYTEQHSLTFLNTSTPFNVGANFISAEGAFANDSSYSISISVNGTTCSASRIHNGVVEYTSTNCTYENGIFTFDTYFVQYYCGTSTVDFTCTYDSTTYVGDKIYHMDKIYGDESGGGGNYYLNTLYSTEEKKIGYWTDGKPLYQKTFTQQLSGITGNIDISALNAETALIIDGYYDIGVTNIGLNEWLSNGNYSYTHVNNELSPPYIDCYCTWSNSTITVTLQYTKTTDTPEPNPQTGGVIYLPSIYSDEEREVGCWVNGKPLYQITIDQTIGSDSDYTIFASGIEDAHIVNAKCEYSSGRWMSANYPSIGSLSSSRFCYAEVWNGALKLHNQTNQSMRWVATIQYTKTADVAGSGTWTPSGELAHHYSTNEQVIGTWIDGKPLYERSISIAGVSISTNQTVTIYTQANISMKCFSGYLTENNITYVIPEVGVRIRQSGDNIQISAQSGASWTISEGYVNIQYTKTTD